MSLFHEFNVTRINRIGLRASATIISLIFGYD
jgi:hypothetical protein